MPLIIDIQHACSEQHLPSDALLQQWLNAAAQSDTDGFEVCLRIVDTDEITELNHLYRQKNKATNVLSFPADIPAELNLPLLGDIVICAQVVKQEAEEQNKEWLAHWAHMCVHGMLHLQGYDHIEDGEANIMEALEIQILQHLGYTSPYDEQ